MLIGLVRDSVLQCFCHSCKVPMCIVGEFSKNEKRMHSWLSNLTNFWKVIQIFLWTSFRHFLYIFFLFVTLHYCFVITTPKVRQIFFFIHWNFFRKTVGFLWPKLEVSGFGRVVCRRKTRIYSPFPFYGELRILW